MTEITADQALANMLDFSEQRTAELIGLVAEQSPISPIYYAEVGDIWRQGDPNSQLLALYYQWQAAMEAQMLAYFAGEYGEAVREELERSGRPVELLEMWDLPQQ